MSKFDIFVFYNCPEHFMDFAVNQLVGWCCDSGEHVQVMTAECNEDWRVLEFYAAHDSFEMDTYIVTPCSSVPDYLIDFVMARDVSPALQQNAHNV